MPGIVLSTTVEISEMKIMIPTSLICPICCLLLQNVHIVQLVVLLSQLAGLGSIYHLSSYSSYPLIPFVSLCHVLSSMVDHGGVACCLVFCVCVIVEIEATMIVRCKSVMFDLTITNITYGDKERETSISIINLQL